MWKKFLRHRLGAFGLAAFLLVLLAVAFAEFISPYGLNQTFDDAKAPPQLPRFVDESGTFHLRPFVYDRERVVDLESGEVVWTDDTEEKYFLRLFVRGAQYQVLFFRSDLHLFGTDGDAPIFLLGSDSIGRDLFTRILYGGRVSIAIGFLTALFAIVIGTAVGLVSGYFGGAPDLAIQRVIELFLIIPSIPLGLSLAAFLPPTLTPLAILVGVAGVLTVTRWAAVARQVRGKALAVREEKYVEAAKAAGAPTIYILYRHILPTLYGHLIVLATLTMPLAIIQEAGLSFLGFGIRPPMTSWGLLLKTAQNFRVIDSTPWIMLPGIAIVITVLALNIVGDTLRDISDPYAD